MDNEHAEESDKFLVHNFQTNPIFKIHIQICYWAIERRLLRWKSVEVCRQLLTIHGHRVMLETFEAELLPLQY